MTPTELKEARARLGLSQRALGECFGLDHKTIWRWENRVHGIPEVVRWALIALEQSRQGAEEERLGCLVDNSPEAE